jgi:hypothetical protein
MIRVVCDGTAPSLLENVPLSTATRTVVPGGTKYVSSLRNRSCARNSVAVTNPRISAQAIRFHIGAPVFEVAG